jgi:hypothetical protein
MREMIYLCRNLKIFASTTVLSKMSVVVVVFLMWSEGTDERSSTRRSGEARACRLIERSTDG